MSDILVTPLQYVLLTEVGAVARAIQGTGRSRTTVWRWKKGESTPERPDAEKLMELFEGLDFNGCYIRSVKIPTEEAMAHGLA